MIPKPTRLVTIAIALSFAAASAEESPSPHRSGGFGGPSSVEEQLLEDRLIREKKDRLGFLDDAVVFDAGGTLEKAYGAELLPWFVVHAAEKGVVHEGSRAPTVERLRSWIGE